MSTPKADKIWHNGTFVDWDQATVHVMSHVLHYGSSWFEGIRCYRTARGAEIFRLKDHMKRLEASCRIYRTELPYGIDELIEATLETIRVNRLQHCYIRPLIFRGLGTIGVNPLKAPVETYIITFEWGKYLGEEALVEGVDVCVSNWARPAPNTFPTMAKTGANYANSALIKMDAHLNGFAEGIALDSFGFVSEGSGENVFLVRDSCLYTTPLSGAILPGITRASVVTLAREAGLEVREESIPREMLYLADEIFLTGTAAEITPVRTVDHIVVGEGRRGPVTERIQKSFFDYVEGRVEDRHGWMTRVYRDEQVESR